MILIGFLIIIATIFSMTKQRAQNEQNKRYRARRQIYTSGKFSEQMELDLRLPYRRFRQLYPESRFAYKDYKKMQMESAFRRSMSSQDNKRMVR
jgi:hypothetical protein